MAFCLTRSFPIYNQRQLPFTARKAWFILTHCWSPCAAVCVCVCPRVKNNTIIMLFDGASVYVPRGGTGPAFWITWIMGCASNVTSVKLFGSHSLDKSGPCCSVPPKAYSKWILKTACSFYTAMLEILLRVLHVQEKYMQATSIFFFLSFREEYSWAALN